VPVAQGPIPPRRRLKRSDTVSVLKRAFFPFAVQQIMLLQVVGVAFQPHAIDANCEFRYLDLTLKAVGF
jgi:hypothetical protein